MFVDFQTEWNSKLLSNRSIVNNNGGNKLRTYRMFKENYQTENYVNQHIYLDVIEVHWRSFVQE